MSISKESYSRDIPFVKKETSRPNPGEINSKINFTDSTVKNGGKQTSPDLNKRVAWLTGIYQLPPPDAINGNEDLIVNELWKSLKFAPGIHPDGAETIGDDFANFPEIRPHLEQSGVTREQYQKETNISDPYSLKRQIAKVSENNPIFHDALIAGEEGMQERITNLLVVLGSHHRYTLEHSIAVSSGMTDDLLEKMGVPKKDWKYVRQGALLHDLGKMSNDILDAPGDHLMNQYEVAVRERHAIVGIEIAEAIGADEAIPYIASVHQNKRENVSYIPSPQTVQKARMNGQKINQSLYGRRELGKTKPEDSVEVILPTYPKYPARDNKDPKFAGQVATSIYDTVTALLDPFRFYLQDPNNPKQSKFTPDQVREIATNEFGHSLIELATIQRHLPMNEAIKYRDEVIQLMIDTAKSYHKKRIEAEYKSEGDPIPVAVGIPIELPEYRGAAVYEKKTDNAKAYSNGNVMVYERVA